MIVSFRHRGLRRLYEADDPSRLSAEHILRLRLILGALDVAETIDDVNIHGFRLHPLKGELKGFWAVTVRANWRVVFRFGSSQVLDVDLVDYH